MVRRPVPGAGEPRGVALPRSHAHGQGEAARPLPTGRVVAAPRARGVHAVGQQDRERVRREVDDHRGAGVAGVPRGARPGQRVHVPALVELEPEPMAVAGEVLVEVGDEQGDALAAQDPLASVGAAVEQRLAQHRQVVGGREDPGVAGHAAEGPRVLVVHLAPDHAPVGCRLELRRGGAGVVGRVVSGVHHAERGGDPVAHDLVEPLSGQALDEHPEGDEVEVAVEVGRAGRALQRRVHDGLDAGGLVGVAAVERQPRREAGGVGQQVPDRHRLLAVGGELRQVCRDRRLEIHAPVLDELDGGDGGEELGHRRQVEDGVLAHGHPLVPRQLGRGVLVAQGVAAGIPGHDGTVMAHERHGAGIHGVPTLGRLLVPADLRDRVPDRRRVEPGVGRGRLAQNGVGGREALERLAEVVGRRGGGCRHGGEDGTDRHGSGQGSHPHLNSPARGGQAAGPR